MALSAAEKMRRYRKRLNEDPEKRRAYLQKEKIRNKEKKKAGIIKPISELSRRDQKARRKYWRDAKNREWDRKKKVNELLSPPTSPANEENIESRQSSNAKRTRRRNIAKCYRENKNLKEKLAREAKRAEMYRKRLARLKETIGKTSVITPRKQTNRQLKQASKKTVRRTLLFHNAFMQQLRDKYKMSGAKEKVTLASILKGNLLKKYGFRTKAVKELGIWSSAKHYHRGHYTWKILGKVRAFFLRDDNSQVTTGIRNLAANFAQYSEHFVPSFESFDLASIREIYEKEVLSLSRPRTYMGIWQVFGLSSVLGVAIFSTYPKLGNASVRKDLHRLILPRSFKENTTIHVMWTSTRTEDMTLRHWVPNHFVSLMQVDRTSKDSRAVNCGTSPTGLDGQTVQTFKESPNAHPKASPPEPDDQASHLSMDSSAPDTKASQPESNGGADQTTEESSAANSKASSPEAGSQVEQTLGNSPATDPKAQPEPHDQAVHTSVESSAANIKASSPESDDRINQTSEKSLVADLIDSSPEPVGQAYHSSKEAPPADIKASQPQVKEQTDPTSKEFLAADLKAPSTEPNGQANHTYEESCATDFNTLSPEPNGSTDHIDKEAPDADHQDSLSESGQGNHTSGEPSAADLKAALPEPDGLLGKFVIVSYDGRAYPGKVLDSDSSDVFVECMHHVTKERNRFFWPRMRDKCWYSHDDILAEIPEPSDIEASRHKRVDYGIWKTISEQFE